MSFLYSPVAEYIYLGIAYYIWILGCTTPASQRLASTSLHRNRCILPHRIPQFFDERFCHFPVIPRQPVIYDLSHPYHQWIDTIWYDVTKNDIVFSQGCVSHIGLLHESVHGRFKHALQYITGHCSLMQKRQKFSDAFREFLSIRCTRLEALVH